MTVAGLKCHFLAVFREAERRRPRCQFVCGARRAVQRVREKEKEKEKVIENGETGLEGEYLSGFQVSRSER